MSMFGGGFTAPPNSACKLRQGMQQPTQQFTAPVRQLGTIPVVPPFGVLPPAPAPAAAQAQMAPRLHVISPTPNLGVQPQQNVQGFARPVAPATAPMPAQGPIGPSSYKVMKKGEAPCPICRG